MGDAPFEFPKNADTILDRRARILSALCDLDEGFSDIPVRSIGQPTLDAMLRLYDEAFFAGHLKNTYRSLRVTLSSRLISAAGKFIYARDAAKRTQKAEIRMSGDFLMRLSYGPFSLNGLSAATPQEAFLIVFEHELCHALETALHGSTSHSSRFMLLANRLFGHTKATHSLPTRRKEAAEQGFCVGSRASFVYQGREFSGMITYVGKTATLMVQSSIGEYKDRYGRRYTKYRVPIEQLKLK